MKSISIALVAFALGCVNGALYGTTLSGGNGGNGNGVVFSINPASGAETVIYLFCSKQNCADGANPVASPHLIDVNGTLYGTTVNGGAYGYGTVFSITP